TTVGHVPADGLADGSRRTGGGAFYSALQAARLGQRALIITQGVPTEIEELLAPYRGELELEVFAARQTTTLQTLGHGAARTQRVLAWAGPIARAVTVDSAVLHLPGREVLELEVPRIEHLVDDLGAGDVFAAAFLTSLLEGRTPVEAAMVGNAAAAVRIGGAGPGAVGGRDAIQARLRASR